MLVQASLESDPSLESALGYSYDDNGNILTGGGRSYSYTSYNLPSTITRNGQTTTLLYGADHERAKEIAANGTITLSLNPRLDSGAHYDQITHPNGVVEKVSTLYSDKRPIAILSSNAQGQPGVTILRYIHVDAQGSIAALSEGNPTTQIVVERYAYDAWGRRRNPNGTDDASDALQTTHTDYGYTGHKHLDGAGCCC